MGQVKPLPDGNYPNTFHSPGIEPWILGFLKARRSLGRVLDVGCGLGFWGFLLKTYVGNYDQLIGLDVSESKLRRLKALNIYDGLVVADASKLPFKDSRLGSIIGCLCGYCIYIYYTLFLCPTKENAMENILCPR